MWKRPVWVIGCTAVAVALIDIGLAKDLKASDWAAWVQAFGSIGAIAAAIFVVQRQHTLESERDRKVELLRRFNSYVSALHLLSSTRQFCEALSESAPQNTPNLAAIRMAIIQIEGHLNALAQMDVLQFESHQLIEALMVTQAFAKTAIASVQAAQRVNADGRPADWGHVTNTARFAADSIKVSEDKAKAEVEQIRPDKGTQ